MKAKLFMIPWLWLIELFLVDAQRVAPPPANPGSQVLTNDLLVDAHRRHFLEMLRRQQQINDALLLNNGLLHPHHIAPLQLPTEPLLPPAPPLFNPFIQNQGSPNSGSTSKLGTYGKDDEEEKDGTVEAPQTVKKSLAGVKTVSIQKKGAIENQASTTAEPVPVGSTTISPEDLEVVQLFKKLNLSKEETKSIVERVEQVVREKLMSKTISSTSTITLPTSTTPTATSTLAPTTTEEEIVEEIEEEQEPEELPVETSSTPPQLHIRSEENLILQRNNLKHHPIKQEKKLPLESEEISEEKGSIKTSLTHLPIFVANEEDDVASQKATLHKRILIASQDREKENDRDLLVDFATGAPLDLTEPEVGKSRVEVGAATAPVYSTLAPVTSPPVAPPRLNYHERTDFERLASDYRRRLENTGDINKILQKISENAYISLVERGGRRKLFAGN